MIGEPETRLKALKMSCYIRMTKIIWIDRITNKEVLDRIRQKENFYQRKRELCEKM